GGGGGGGGGGPGEESSGLLGFARPGAAADFVPAPAADLAAKPTTVNHAAAAAVPLGALTAWQALHEHALLQPGQHVLIHGGAGGAARYAAKPAPPHGGLWMATTSPPRQELVGRARPCGGTRSP